MKRINLLGTLAMFILVAGGCATVYTAPGLQPVVQTKSIAILPFDVKVQYNRLPKSETLEQIYKNERNRYL